MEEEGGKFVNETTNSRGNEGKRKNRRACDPAGLTQKKTQERETEKPAWTARATVHSVPSLDPLPSIKQ